MTDNFPFQKNPIGLIGDEPLLKLRRPAKKRRVFFSFDYDDVFPVNIVRNRWVMQDPSAREFVDAANREKQKNEPSVIRRWINDQLDGCSVTAVLIGWQTSKSKWIKYEIEKSRELKKGILGIYIHKIPDARRFPRYATSASLRSRQPLGLLSPSLDLSKFSDFSDVPRVFRTPDNPLAGYRTFDWSQGLVPEYQIYDWKSDKGPENIGQWIEEAAQAAGR